MKVKTIINLLLGFGSMLSLNENFNALYLNFIGIACFALLLWLNPTATTIHK